MDSPDVDGVSKECPTEPDSTARRKRRSRRRSTLKTSWAVAAGIAHHVWTVEEIVGLLDAKEAADSRRDRRCAAGMLPARIQIDPPPLSPIERAVELALDRLPH